MRPIETAAHSATGSKARRVVGLNKPPHRKRARANHYQGVDVEPESTWHAVPLSIRRRSSGKKRTDYRRGKAFSKKNQARSRLSKTAQRENRRRAISQTASALKIHKLNQ